MPDGILDSAPIIRPVQAFSPTRYTAFVECPLRAVWSANGAPALLPTSPSARLGRVVHALLQEAGEGRFVSSNDDAINDRWQQLVNNEESHMETQWLDRHFIPLRTAVPQYEVRRIQSCKRALQITNEAAVYKPGTDLVYENDAQYGFEFPVSSRDGAIRGRIDAVLPSAEGPVIRDYKSGIVFEEGRQGIIKQEYEIQLKLYAALYESTCGRWPAALEIVSLTGAAERIAFDSKTCKDLLDGATDALHKLDRTIKSGEGHAGELEGTLARPSTRNCSYCQYRPGCWAYKEVAVPGENDWPKDVMGQVELIQHLGNSKYMITVRTPAGVMRVRGLDSSPRRHPAIPHLISGDKVGAFNLSGRAGNAFVESAYTTLYKIVTA